MRPVIGLVGRHAISIGKLPVDHRVKVGECITHIAVELAHAGFVGRHVWLRCVINKIVREQFFEHLAVFIPKTYEPKMAAANGHMGDFAGLEVR